MFFRKNRQSNPGTLKKRLFAAAAMLLVASVLMGTTSYAWLVMSVAPEITGISMNVGSNGSLEMALLNSETRQDMTTIRTGIGESLANRAPTANNTWGNLVDLSDKSYGMENIMLLPARLNAVKKAGGDGYVVDSGLLAIPTYGYDGRIVELTDDTVSAIYNNREFSYVVGMQDYGVRAIGTSESLSAQGSALATAKANIITYKNSAANAAVASLNENGEALFGLLLAYTADPSTTFTDTELDVLKGMISSLQGSANYLDLSLRQGLVAFAASAISDENAFTAVRDQIIDTSTSLSTLMEALAAYTEEIPAEFTGWIDALNEIQNDLTVASNGCNALTGGSYTWNDLKEPLGRLMNTEFVYINDTLFGDLSEEDAMGLLGKDISMTLAPGSGVYASVADFTENYSALFSAIGSAVTIKTLSTVSPAYLIALSSVVNMLEAADGSTESGAAVTLTHTYGYALDMAFRCNAPVSDLLLQTAAIQRVYSGSESSATLGGGSYMKFPMNDSSVNPVQMIQLMDAVRVGFLDDQGNLLGVAKLNTSNRISDEDSISAALYLYDYSFSEEDGSMVMGERQKTSNVIAPLDQNIAKAITVVVWLDGDLVDNTMVSATDEKSMSGILNLQFASSADLVPADNTPLLEITSDKSDLKALVEANELFRENGKGTYTTLSWDAYTDAFSYAVAVQNDSMATESQIYNAARELTETRTALEEVSHDAIAALTQQIRQFTGSTGDVAKIVLSNGTATDTYTQEQYDNRLADIYRVNYNNNLHDEGHDIRTPIYTDESWSGLAAALYAAEAVQHNPNASNDEIDAAMVALANSYDALERKIFYVAYDYEGELYYFGYSDDPDTYGRWYDSAFQRIFSDLKILELDAYAVPATIAYINQYENIPYYHQLINPSVTLDQVLYPTLAVEEIIAAQWNLPSMFVNGMTPSQRTALIELIAEATRLGVSQTLIKPAQEIVDGNGVLTYDEVQEVIQNLWIVVQNAYPDTSDSSSTDPYMTSDQRILLTTAVNAAKGIEGYDDETIEALNDLRTAVSTAETILASTANVQATDADAALAALNTQLVANGEREVTAYNTLQHTLPESFDLFDVVYEVNNPRTSLYVTGTTGTDTLSVLVLTRNGVIFTAEKSVTVYSPAAGIFINNPNPTPDGGELNNEFNYIWVNNDKYQSPERRPMWDRNMNEGTSAQLSLSLLNRSYTVNESGLHTESGYYCDSHEYKAGDPVYGDHYIDTRGVSSTRGVALFTETLNSTTARWASSNTKVLTVTYDSTGYCTINAVAPGTAILSVSVTTSNGNTYSSSIEITVTKADVQNGG